MKNSSLIKLFTNHIDEIQQFIVKEFKDVRFSNRRGRISVNCPFCGDSRHRHKLAINIDWGNYKCFRCGRSGSFIKLFREIGIYEKFSELLTAITDISAFNFQLLCKSNAATIENVDKSQDDDNVNLVAKSFITKRGLMPISRLSIAKSYALSRTYNNLNEIEAYLADDKYIYIPITANDEIVAYVSRLYVNLENLPKYMIHTLNDRVPLIGFFDEVTNNLTTNSIYITEGYFDAYAINYAMSNYVSICTFGKAKQSSILNIAKYFTPDTKIYLTLDSAKKDPDIVSDTIRFGKILEKYFSNISVVVLDDSDPADILAIHGPLYLKEILIKNAVPFIKYRVSTIFTSKR